MISLSLFSAMRLFDENRWISGRFCGWAEDDFFAGAFEDVDEVAPADRVVRRLSGTSAGLALSSVPSA